MNDTTPNLIKWTNENIINLVRKVRNDLIKDFLDERFLKQYLVVHYNLREISPIKIEFIKAELKELLITPVDIEHYQPIIKKIKETDTASLSEGNEELFYKEMDGVLKKFIY